MHNLRIDVDNQRLYLEIWEEIIEKNGLYGWIDYSDEYNIYEEITYSNRLCWDKNMSWDRILGYSFKDKSYLWKDYI